jgi:1,4-alpha-glucan branching enzyme
MRRWLPSLSLALLSLASAASGQELGAKISKNGTNVTGVTFRVWAPNAVAVHVAGDFNGWNESAAKLTRDPATNVWTATFSSARPGHAYKYIISTTSGGTLRRKDPRAREVRTMGDGSQAAVIYDKDAFVWEDEGFQPPFPNQIVMYELHVGTFYDPRPDDGEPATFYDAAQKLDYLRDLGVNMIALMPVSEFNGRHSWGYNPIALFAIEQAYGGPDGFKHFVNEAHKRGIAVQVDVVHNHYGDLAAPGASDLENFDGGNPYFYHGTDEVARPGIGRTKWGPRPRYSDPEVRRFIKENIKMYLDEYKVWALRWDSPRNITGFDSNPGSEVGDPDTDIEEAITMMQDINSEIHARNERYYSIAEDANSVGGYSGHWEISFHNVLFPRLLPLDTDGSLPAPFEGKLRYPTLNQRETDNIGYRLVTKEPPGFRVIFSENHDKCGDLNALTDGARLAEDFDPIDPTSYLARKKSILASAVTLTSAGTPMLFQGQEQLSDGFFDAYVHLDWLRASSFPEIVRFHRDATRLRRNATGVSAALQATVLPDKSDDGTGATRITVANEAQGWMVYERRAGTASQSIMVAVNFSDQTRNVSFNFPVAGPWYVLLNSDAQIYGADFGNIGPAVGAAVTASGGANTGTFQIGPFSAIVLGKTAGTAPSADANANGIDDGWEILFGASDAAGDIDGDGFSNLDEFLKGTDPTVADRAALAGSFNDWNTETRNARWDPTRSVWRYVARFSVPGLQTVKANLSDGWVAGGNHSFDVPAAGAYEITYAPASGTYSSSRVDADANGNGMADVWERFHFYPATTAVASANPDGDAFNNLTEFQRGSDPSEFDQPAMGVVGAYNGWNWQARNMRYAGHGVWTFAVPFLQSPSVSNYKFGVGPTQDDANWGQPTAQKPDGFKSEVDFVWANGLKGWHLVRFNEKNFVTSVAPIAGTADRDGDGMPDSWENYFRLDPFGNDAAGDADDDQVLNSFEYERLSLPDTADRFAVMHMPGGGLWDENDARTRMVWNRDVGRWEFLLHMLSAGNHSFKFMAGTYAAGTWGWDGIDDIPGTSDRWANGNIVQSLGSSGHYVVRFEEISGIYQFSVLPTVDTDGDGMPDVWEKFHGLQTGVPDALSDKDGDGVRNGLEYARGSSPSFDDHFDDMFMPGDGLWNAGDAARRMAWNPEIGRWEFPVFGAITGASRTAELKFSLSTYTAGTWGWGPVPSPGQAVRWANGNVAAVLNGRRWHLVRFEEYSARYEIVEMSATDSDGDGLPDDWERTIGLSNAAQDADGDGWSNLNEFVRGSNPRSADLTPKRMTVTGDSPPLPDWTPNAYNMTWSDQRGRWEWSGLFPSARSVQFKFSQANADWNGGTSWGAGPTAGVAQAGAAGNLSQSVVGNTRYLVHFDDQTGMFEFVRYPVSLEWLTVNGLAEMPRDPWTADNDSDGVANLQEYALGGNPNLSDRSAAPTSLTTNVDGTNRLVLRWLERTNGDSTLTFVPQMSTNLKAPTWTPLVSSDAADNTGVPANHRRKEASVPMDGAGKFLRIRVNGP